MAPVYRYTKENILETSNILYYRNNYILSAIALIINDTLSIFYTAFACLS